jgi:hypothetical protein
MVYSITFELKSNPSTRQKQTSTAIWAKSKAEPTIDKIQGLVERLYGDDVDKKTIHVVKGGEEWDEKEMQKGARLYDLDQE